VECRVKVSGGKKKKKKERRLPHRQIEKTEPAKIGRGKDRPGLVHSGKGVTYAQQRGKKTAWKGGGKKLEENEKAPGGK